MSDLFKADDIAESLFNKPYHVIDVLPERVPEERAGSYFRFENYCLSRLQIIYGQFSDVLIKLCCYFDILIFTEGKWEANPDFQRIEDVLLSSGFVNILLPSVPALISLNKGDLYMTVYNASGDLLSVLRDLCRAEGLFIRNS
ncbi:MAG: hypothetical protein IJS72_03595 [Oscillospiraceae bacterium]|nr:hypothetical protein [Oscillospiraceae bacterium]